MLLAGMLSLSQMIAQTQPSTPRFTGLLNVQGRKAVILESTSPRREING